MYLDSACTSLTPQQVIDAVSSYYTELAGCAGRSAHYFAHMTSNAITDVREQVADFIGGSAKEIIFTKNTTESINLIAYQLQKLGGTVVISDKEHNSNFLPWRRLAQEESIQLYLCPTSTTTGSIDYELYIQYLASHADDPGIKLVSFVDTSNLDGSRVYSEDLAKKAHEYGFLVHVDAAQRIPHEPIDVTEMDIDLLSFSGHKMLGPTGIGVLWGRYHILESFVPMIIGGGSPAHITCERIQYLAPPERFESGIQHYAGIVGLGRAVSYLQKIYTDYGTHAVSDHTHALAKQAKDIFRTLGERVKVIGPTEEYDANLVSFFIEGMDSQQVAYLLNEKANVMTRAGHHCVHSFCGKYELPHLVRASFYLYNTSDDVNTLGNTVTDILNI